MKKARETYVKKTGTQRSTIYSVPYHCLLYACFHNETKRKVVVFWEIILEIVFVKDKNVWLRSSEKLLYFETEVVYFIDSWKLLLLEIG